MPLEQAGEQATVRMRYSGTVLRPAAKERFAWIFDFGAEMYGWLTSQPAWRESCSRMAESLPDRGTVVDFGCGPGVSTFELARLKPGATIIGLDIAARMLNDAKKRQRRQTRPARPISWIRGNALMLPFASGSIDAATGHSFLYLLPNRKQALAEIRRVLRPGGRLALMEPNDRTVSFREILGVSRDVRYLLSVSLWRPMSVAHGRFSAGELEDELTSSGFEQVRVQETLGGLGLRVLAARS